MAERAALADLNSGGDPAREIPCSTREEQPSLPIGARRRARIKRLWLQRFRRMQPWLRSPDRINEMLPGRSGAFLSAVGWLFCRESTILIFSFSFAFLLSIFPLIVLLLSLMTVLPLDGLRETLFLALQHFFPVSQEWIVRNLQLYISTLGMHQVISVILMAWAGAALFFALEAALECAYRVQRPRNFVGSQVRGTLLMLALGALAILATAALHLLAVPLSLLLPATLSAEQSFTIAYYAVALVVVFCLISCAYHWLPNRNAPFSVILPEALFATVLLLIADGVFRWLAPTMGLEAVYGPFYVSVTILLWGYTFGCIVVGSARLAANGFFTRRAMAFAPKDSSAPTLGVTPVSDG